VEISTRKDEEGGIWPTPMKPGVYNDGERLTRGCGKKWTLKEPPIINKCR
jgi:hypothetical protein